MTGARKRTRRVAPDAGTVAMIYCRISESADAALERQDKACRQLAAARGWPVVAAYVDDGISAYNGATRPSFDRMIEDAATYERREGKPVVLIVWDLDRLVRRVAEVGRLIDLYDDHAVPFVTVQGGVDMTSEAGKLVAVILTAVAEMESGHKAERLRLRFEQDRDKGTPHWSFRPFGFERVDGTWQHHGTEAAVLVQLYRRADRGESLRSLVRWLSAEGITQPERKDPKSDDGAMIAKPFTVGALSALLKADRNVARYRSKVEGLTEHTTDGAWEPIIDADTFARVVAKLATYSAGGRSNRFRHLMSGLSVCGVCGNRMSCMPRAQGNGSVYRCRKDPGCAQNGCGLAVAKARVDEIATDAVLAWLADPANRDRLAVPEDKADAGVLLDVIATGTERKRQLIALTTDKTLGVTPEDIAAELRTIAATVDGARTQLAKVRAKSPVEHLPTDPDALRAGWDAMAVEDQRDVIAEILEPVVIRPSTKRGRIFDTSRVVVAYRYPAAA